MPIFARLKPQAPRQGFPLLSCTYQSIRFEAGGPAQEVTPAQAKFLRDYHEVETDPASPLAFEVWEGRSAEGPPVPVVPPPFPPVVRRPPPQDSGMITTADIRPPQPTRPLPPTLQEVVQAGYKGESAEWIVANEKQKAAAGMKPYGDREPVDMPPLPPDPAPSPLPPDAVVPAPYDGPEMPTPPPEPDLPDPTNTPEAQAARAAAEAKSREMMAARVGPEKPKTSAARSRYRKVLGDNT